MLTPLTVHTVVSAPFAENTLIFHRADSPGCVVIDPGFEPDAVLDYLRGQGLMPEALLNTHGHVDHIAGNQALKDAYPAAPLMIGRGDAAMLTDPALNLSEGFGLPVVSPPADRLLAEGDRLDLLGTAWEVRELPGHSPGHIVFVLPAEGAVVGGDVLFRGGVGRTDFPGGSMELLLAGIRAKLWPLADETVVYPGHGPATTVGHEKRTNPFLAGGSEPHG